MGTLDYYRRIEDAARRDSTEGIGEFRTDEPDVLTVHLGRNGQVLRSTSGPGEVTHHVDFGNPIFILSCCHPELHDGEVARRNFGDIAVRISDPVQFCRDLTDYCAKQPARSLLVGATAEIEPVTYDKGMKLPSGADKREMMKRAYTQKPQSFSTEAECRIVIIAGRVPIAKENVPDVVVIDLGKYLPYAQIIG